MGATGGVQTPHLSPLPLPKGRGEPWNPQTTNNGLQLKAENKYCLCCSESFNCFQALMRTILAFAAGIALAGGAFADIQDPPSNDYGPTRKLGRGLSNFFIAPAELPVTIAKINTDEGNAAASGYGVIRGTGRAFARFGVGFYEVLLWPFPVNKG